MGKYSKAIVSALIAAGTAFVSVSTDGVVDGGDIGLIVGAFATAFGVTWAVPNAQQSDRSMR